MARRPTAPAAQFQLDTAFQLPDTARTLNGTQFDPRNDIWRIQDPVHTVRLDFRRLNASPQIRFETKQTFLWYAENGAIETLRPTLSHLASFFQHEANFTGAPVARITANAILRYRANFTRRKIYILSAIIGPLRKWHALGLSGVTDDVIEVLDRIRLTYHSRSEAVLTLDPHTGPLSRLESNLLHNALEAAHASSTLPLQDYLLASLFRLLGPRPVQVAALKVCDVLVVERQDGAAPDIFLNVPRAKQPASLRRQEFHPYRLPAPIGPKMAEYAQQLKDDFAHLLDDPSQAPLFPAKKNSRIKRPDDFAAHRTARAIGGDCTNIYRRLNVQSERCNGPINATARRHRHTMATRLAEAGTSVFAIAEALDHSTSSTAGAYIEATSSMRGRIDEALARQLAPTINAFKGTLSSEEAHAGTQDLLITDPRFVDNARPMASCAHHGDCNLFAPLACYTCRSHRPWADARPHKRVLHFLLEQRERQRQTLQPAMYTSLDTIILAVTRVIQKCEELQSANGIDT